MLGARTLSDTNQKTHLCNVMIKTNSKKTEHVRDETCGDKMRASPFRMRPYTQQVSSFVHISNEVISGR